jgi:hypothetical protein
MPLRLLPRLSPRPLPLLVATLTACGGGGGKDSAALASGKTAAAAAEGPACTSRDTTAVGQAVLEYITTASPHPQRYLTAAGTDSAVPDDGFKVLQNKGPTYFYSSDPKAQQQIKDKLASVGPYASLLVVYRGKDEAENGNLVTVRLGGHYVGGEHDGKAATERRIDVRCGEKGWKVMNPQEAQKPVPAPVIAPSAASPAKTP